MKLHVQGREAYAYTGGKGFDPSLPCVVFIHGALHDHSVWTLLARWFAHHGRCVLAVDLPAHGRSAGPPPADVQAAADWVLALMDAAQVPRAALVGHSMGSLIALETAARAPTRATHLVMVGTAYPMAVSDALLALSRDAPLQAIDKVTALSHATLATKPSYPGPGAWLHGGSRALMRHVLQGWPEGNLFHHDFSLCNAYAHGLQAAALRRCPASLILGAQDQMTRPQAAQGLAQALRAQVHTVPGGHMPMAEAPDQVLGLLRAALA
jgi:pimeloyl-ACP methyl ester carboxylesterase